MLFNYCVFKIYGSSWESKKKKKKEISSRDKQVKLEAINRKIKNVNNKISEAKVTISTFKSKAGYVMTQQKRQMMILQHS